MPAGDDSADSLLAALGAWAAGERTARAAAERSRQRWLRQQVAESATLVGTLVDLAEGATPVVIQLAGPGAEATVTGRLVGVAEDFAVVERAAGGPALVAVAAIEAVTAETAPTAIEATGERGAPLTLTLAGALAGLAAERAAVVLRLRSGTILAGDLVGVGADVVSLRAASAPQRRHYVAAGAVAACLLT